MAREDMLNARHTSCVLYVERDGGGDWRRLRRRRTPLVTREGPGPALGVARQPMAAHVSPPWPLAAPFHPFGHFVDLSADSTRISQVMAPPCSAFETEGSSFFPPVFFFGGVVVVVVDVDVVFISSISFIRIR